jgi:hypothetical protein
LNNKKNKLIGVKNPELKKYAKKNWSKEEILNELRSSNLKYSLVIICSSRINFSEEYPSL